MLSISSLSSPLAIMSETQPRTHTFGPMAGLQSYGAATSRLSRRSEVALTEFSVVLCDDVGIHPFTKRSPARANDVVCEENAG